MTSNKDINRIKSANFWDFVITISNNGQIIPLLGFIFATVYIALIPKNDLIILSKDILKLLEHWHLLGWIILLIQTGISIYQFKRNDTKHNKEMDRITEEKKVLHEKLIGKISKSNKS